MNKYKNKNDEVSIIKQTTPVSDIFHLKLQLKTFYYLLILGNNYFFRKQLGSIWESATPLCMDYM